MTDSMEIEKLLDKIERLEAENEKLLAELSEHRGRSLTKSMPDMIHEHYGQKE
jgi:cell division septum initiation protein DivIVA